MIRLTCPSCQTELMIDEGFRGGVCRCFNCGTLMTVPEDPDHQQAESLSRPEAPEKAPSRTGSFTRTGTFRTTSGRTVELSTQQMQKIPVAKKRRMGVRIAVYVTVLGILLSLVVIVGIGVSVMMNQPTGPDAGEIYQDIFGLSENPYLTKRPVFMGAPLTGTTVMITDASASMRDYLDYIKKAGVTAIANGGKTTVQFIVASELGPVIVPDQPTAASAVDAGAVSRRLDDIAPQGGIALAPAFAAALKAKPTQIVLVARDLPDDDELRKIAADVTAAKARLNVVLIDTESPLLADLAKQTGGKLLTVSGGQLRRWYEESLAGK